MDGRHPGDASSSSSRQHEHLDDDPAPSPPLPSATTTSTFESAHDIPSPSLSPAPPRAAQRIQPRRAITDPMGSKGTFEGGHVRFSDDVPRDSMRGFDPADSQPNLNSHGLYTIPSRGDLESHILSQPSSSRAHHSSDQSSAQPSESDLKYPVYRPEPSKRAKWVVAKETLGDQVKKAYSVYIVQGLLRQKPLPPSADGRHIPMDRARNRGEPLIDERTRKPYISNFIRSSRYTIWSFLPKQLFFQFSKMGNFYFLVVGTVQAIPGLSTTGSWTTIGPLAAFVSLSMAKEGYDDYRRYLLARTENLSRAWVLGERSKKATARMKRHQAADAEMHSDELSDGEWAQTEWQDIKVGDIIKLGRDDDVPADIVLLSASGPNGTAYIETMALDGETNLKAKRASPLLAERCSTVEGIKSCEAMIVSEDPNVDLYRYDGRVTVKEETLPLSLDNVVYRGSTVRNTTEAIGIVVNSGEECKIRMNAQKHVRTKAPAMQRVLNRIVIWLIFVLLGLSSGLTLGYSLWKDPTETESWYLMGETITLAKVFIAYVLMFNTLIPLSLYISLEIIKIIQFYMMGDVEMYDPVSNTPMVANTTTILEDLGQVNYVFSDKTGTLTENVMRFRKMSVAGTAWLHDMDIERDEQAKQKLIDMARKKRKGKGKDKNRDKKVSENLDNATTPLSPQGRPSVSSFARRRSTSKAPESDPELKTEDLLEYLRRKPDTAFSKKAKQFLLCIALCHTCLPETLENGQIEYQAASPDELALVEAARDLGYIVIDRPAQSVILQLPGADGSMTKEKYQVLDVIEFSSQRKRMSIVIRMPDGRVCVFCKGADNVILPRLKLSGLALQKADAVQRRASIRRSVEKEMAHQHRMSIGGTPRNSVMLGRASMSGRSMTRRESLRISGDLHRRSSAYANDPESWSPRRESQDILSPMSVQEIWPSPRASMAMDESDIDEFIDESIALNEGAVFEKCFQHMNDFASDGLRTLLYGYRYIPEDDYVQWKKIYQDATTSLDNRQEKIEAAGELIEDKFDLAGATAIEDRLQEGVPETIEKLRRADIKVWMLTGDKRETAINIGHSAGLCKPFSEVFILDSSMGNLQESILSTLGEVSRGMLPHSVVVVDGQTLGDIENDEDLSFLFFDLAVRADSVICCRASPSQKAMLVKRIRRQVPHSLTLAIGDGANDIGMIQASHVGIGISGREGLQAARISDYAIAQFRFLQRLLFVHGRWNYLRTGKYILATFWKEIVFFLPQAYFQRYNGHSGTSLYENWSLTVFNTFFTSLAVILLGGLEKDLQAKTLIEYPELYTYGHKSRAFNVRLYIGWTFMGLIESAIIYWATWAVYTSLPFDLDTTLYAMGTVPFTVCVVFINIKLMVLEMENKTLIILAGFLISVGGWFLWNIILSAAYPHEHRIYLVRHAFLDNFGHTLNFWAVVFVTLSAVVIFELLLNAIRRVYMPQDVDFMQRLERDGRKGRGGVEAEDEATVLEVIGQKQDGGNGVSSEGMPRKSHHSGRLSYQHARMSRKSRDESAARAFTPPIEESSSITEVPSGSRQTKKPMLSVATKWLGNSKGAARSGSPIELRSTSHKQA